MRTLPLLEEHPRPVQFILAVVVPALFGALTGYILGVSEPVYLVFSVIGVVGGIGAGYDHVGARAGALRGILAGVVFGSSILIAHEIHGAVAKAHLPEPAILLVVITTLLGCAFGALGGWLRARTMRGGEVPEVAGVPEDPPSPTVAAPVPTVAAPTPPPPATVTATAPTQPAATPAAPPAPSPEGPVSLTTGSFDEYRAMGMSVTQAKRVIEFREKDGGYTTVDDLDRVPGFSKGFLAEMKLRLTV